MVLFFEAVPSAPIGPLKVSDITASSATLSWKAPKEDGGQPIKRYIVERRDTRCSAWVQVETPRPNVLTLTTDKLIENLEYLFRVSAENIEGQGPYLETKEPITPRRVPGTANLTEILNKAIN